MKRRIQLTLLWVFLSPIVAKAQVPAPKPMAQATIETSIVRPGRFEDRPRQVVTRAALGPTPFYGRCNYNFDGALVCVKFPGIGESRCAVTNDCYTPTPSPTATEVRTPTPSATPRLSCICACRNSDAARELLCSSPFTYSVTRIGHLCPDKESGWYPWGFERDSLAVPARRSSEYCSQRWDGKDAQGFSSKAPTGPSIRCTLEQCREGVLRRAWP